MDNKRVIIIIIIILDRPLETMSRVPLGEHGQDGGQRKQSRKYLFYYFN